MGRARGQTQSADAFASVLGGRRGAERHTEDVALYVQWRKKLSAANGPIVGWFGRPRVRPVVQTTTHMGLRPVSPNYDGTFELRGELAIDLDTGEWLGAFTYGKWDSRSRAEVAAGYQLAPVLAAIRSHMDQIGGGDHPLEPVNDNDVYIDEDVVARWVSYTDSLPG